MKSEIKTLDRPISLFISYGHKEIMTTFFLAGVFFFAFSPAAHAMHWYSSVGGTQYVFEVKSSSENVWNPNSGENPPLSPKQAFDVALKFMSQVPAPPESPWELAQITLTKVEWKRNEWVYAVTFAPRKAGFNDNLTVVVTMSGKIATFTKNPVEVKEPPRQRSSK